MPNPSDYVVAYTPELEPRWLVPRGWLLDWGNLLASHVVELPTDWRLAGVESIIDEYAPDARPQTARFRIEQQHGTPMVVCEYGADALDGHDKVLDWYQNWQTAMLQEERYVGSS